MGLFEIVISEGEMYERSGRHAFGSGAAGFCFLGGQQVQYEISFTPDSTTVEVIAGQNNVRVFTLSNDYARAAQTAVSEAGKLLRKPIYEKVA